MYSRGTLSSPLTNASLHLEQENWCGKGEPPNGIASCWLLREVDCSKGRKESKPVFQPGF